VSTATHQGRKAIAVAGTAIALASAQEVQWLICIAPLVNKGFVFVGSSTVTGAGTTVGATDGYILAPGTSTPKMGPCDLAEVYIEGKAADCVYWMAGSGTSTAGITVIQPTASLLNATTVPAGWTPSAELGVATNIVKASAGILHCFLIETNGTANAVVQAYNHASSATNPITPSIVVPGGDRYGGSGPIDVACSNGIVIVVSGTNAVVTAYYS